MRHVFRTQDFSINVQLASSVSEETDVQIKIEWNLGCIQIHGFVEEGAIRRLASAIDMRYDSKHCNAELHDIDHGFTLSIKSNECRNAFTLSVNLAVNDLRGQFKTDALPLTHEQLSIFRSSLRQYLDDSQSR